MYRLNNLQRNVLITADEVLFHAPTKHTLDLRMIENSIIIAEERFIRPRLCNEFYEELCSAKNKEITSGNKAAIETEVSEAVGSSVTFNVGDIVNASEWFNANQLLFWKQFLWKLTAECVMMLATAEGFIQFGSEGLVHNAPIASPLNTTGVSTPELRSVKWLMDKKLMDRIDPLIEAMHAWLCGKKSLYPKYCKFCDCDSNGVPYRRKSDLITGLYDDEPECGCGC